MSYTERLIALGYPRCCAERIVQDYEASGKESDLQAYIIAKEHVLEVLG